jgi:DnaJ-class molecular chaperone
MAVAYKDYYKILGVAKTADAKAIKQAYRRLARKHHPDMNPGNRGAAERFKEINEANTVLSDPEKRRRYDTLGPDWERYGEGVPGGGGRSGNFGDYHVRVDTGDLGDFSEFFRTFFGGGAAGAGGAGGTAGSRTRTGEDLLSDVFGRRGRRARRGQDYQTPVEISLEEAAQGARRTVEVGMAEACPTCSGSGRQGKSPCPICQGSGEVTRSQRVEVKIPAGVRDGARVRVAGEGGSGSGGGPRGDLYLQVRVLPHPTFERRDDDLYVDLPVMPWEAALGAELEVPTLRGKVSMKIPAETSSGKTFRLPGYGLPHVRGGAPGDQLVRVKIVIPPDLSPREKELFEELRRLRPRPPR